MKNISLHELPKYMTANTLLVDVRMPIDYVKNHLDGAINMPYTNVLSMIKSYPKNKPIIVYCSEGHHSKRVARMLVSLGYTEVYNLQGIGS